ncbi:YlmC/YmxH family sporulation protein [Vulcanibacillus modesticaldus]|uniref:YlmC/YmxH family sporulation protein n=1 Tax=Vulcanibacillus modesticaldus TaxID=337097 RepID=A0A1D2YV58_9BACI|nr:YlmC/YmxH family sporulation protein [Vulcanibacillus modesticaldus]OEF99535.1 YlmC/YmxH family sporulation protein [Vulcanibacillus modesticaldus]
MLKISEFQTKDVVNIFDGKKLGNVTDLEIDLRHGRVESLIVPAQSKLFGLFGNGAEYIIPWNNIIKIGVDVVLVKLDDHSYRSSDSNEEYELFKKNN